MNRCTLNYTIGLLPEYEPGQWIEGCAEISPGEFTFVADLCQRHPNKDFALYRLETTIDRAFRASLFRALLDFVLRPPFKPSRNRLRLEISGDVEAADGEIANLILPEIRQNPKDRALPAEIFFDLCDQWAYAKHLNEIQGFQGLGSDPGVKLQI